MPVQFSSEFDGDLRYWTIFPIIWWNYLVEDSRADVRIYTA